MCIRKIAVLRLVPLLAILLNTAIPAAPVERDEALWSHEVVAGGFMEPPRSVRIEGWQWDHEVRVWLPPTYHATTRTYPTLWVTDNMLEIAFASLIGAGRGFAPSVILVSIGSPRGTSAPEFQRRRTYEFTPRVEAYAAAEPGTIGGAPEFLDFLVNTLRPELESQYRMDPNDHAFAGHSGGANFGLYVLFNKPESFQRYIISSPATGPWLDMEQEYSEKHGDIKARVFLSAGGAEMRGYLMAQAGIVSTVALVTERLTMREYPSLDFDTHIFPGESHSSVATMAYARGIRSIWSERVPKEDKAAYGRLAAQYSKALAQGEE